MSAWLGQFYVGLSGVIALLYSVTMVQKHAAWPLGDWLINFSGGFVRRGLPGEVILLVSHTSGVPLLWVAGAVQIFCVLVFTASVCWLVRRLFIRPTSWWEKALLFSPATLAFVWFDPEFILRKEICLFALLGALAVYLVQRPQRKDVLLSLSLSISCPLLLLSHEGLVCYLPYLFAVIALARRSSVRALKICFVPAVLCLVPIGLSVLYPGTPLVSASVCNSVGGPETGLCYGPIFYLGIPRAAYEGEVRSLMGDVTFLWAFGLTTILALLPAACGIIDLWRRPVSRKARLIIPAATLASAVASLVLFAQAQDWSRWLYIHMICLLILLFFAAIQRQVEEAATSSTQSACRWHDVVWTCALLLYATAWNLPGLRQHDPFGYVNVIQRLATHAPRS